MVFACAPLLRPIEVEKKFSNFPHLEVIYRNSFRLSLFEPEGKKFGTRSWCTDVAGLGPS